MAVKTAKKEDFALIPLSEVRLDGKNIRTEFNDGKLSELADSIQQRGVLNPITCRRLDGHLELIAGERRLRAAKMAGLTHVPAVIREADDTEVTYDRIVENLQREDLSDEDQFRALTTLRDSGLKTSQISKMTGLSTTSIQRILVLETLQPSIRERDDISRYEKSFIARAPEEVQGTLAERISERTISSQAIGHEVMPAINEVLKDELFSEEEKKIVIKRIAQEATKERPARSIVWQEKGKKKLQEIGVDVEISSNQALRDLLNANEKYCEKLLALQATQFDHLDPKLVVGIVHSFRQIHSTLGEILDRIETSKRG